MSPWRTALAHRPIGGLAEVAPLSVLHVGPAGEQGDGQVGDGGAGEHPQVLLLHQVGEDEPLPVPVQHVLGTGGGEAEAGAPGGGLQQQVDLGVVAQGLEVAHPLHRGGDGLFVEDAPGAEGHLQAEPVPDEPGEHLQLHRAHELQADLSGLLAPGHMELGVLLLQLPQLLQGGVHVGPLGEDDLIGEDRLQQGDGGLGLKAQPLPGVGAAQPRHGAHPAGGDGVCRPELGAGVDPQLVRLLLPHLVRREGAVRPLVGEKGLHLQAAPGDLQIGEAHPLGVPGDLEHLGPELLGVDRGGGVPLHPL